MTNRTVTASFGASKKKKAKQGAVQGIQITVGKNGYTAYCQHEGDYSSPEHTVFKSKQEVADYVLSELPDVEGATAPADTDNDGDAGADADRDGY